MITLKRSLLLSLSLTFSMAHAATDCAELNHPKTMDQYRQCISKAEFTDCDSINHPATQNEYNQCLFRTTNVENRTGQTSGNTQMTSMPMPNFKEFKNLSHDKFESSSLKDCQAFTKVGYEDELDSCIKKSAKADLSLINACSSIKETNRDRFFLCMNIVTSEKKDARLFESNCGFMKKTGREMASCLTKFKEYSHQLSSMDEDKMANTATGLVFYPSNEEYKMDEKGQTPDMGLLNQCSSNLKPNPYFSNPVNGGHFFKGTHKKILGKSEFGTYYQVNGKNYFFSDEKIAEATKKSCGASSGIYCQLQTTIAGKRILISVSPVISLENDFPLKQAPMAISFSANEKYIDVMTGAIKPADFKPQKIDTKEGTINAQLAYSLIKGLNQDLNDLSKEGKKMSEEAYLQYRKKIDTCLASMKQIAPKTVEATRIEMDSKTRLAEIYKGSRIIATDPGVDCEDCRYSTGSSK